jgi:hypothetical protein
MLTHTVDPRELDMCEQYLEGMSSIAKTDVQMSFLPQGVLAFYQCLRTAMAVYGDVQDGDFPAAVRKFVVEAIPRFEEGDLSHLVTVAKA